MIKYSFPLFLLLALTFNSCGTSKKSTDQPIVASKTDFAYIQKFHEGVRLKSRGQVQEAIVAFETCLKTRQDDDAVYFALSTLYLQNGDRAKAGEYIQKASKLDPKNMHYTTELAYFYYDEKRFNEAVTCFQKLVKSEPRNPDFQYGLAECYIQAGKPQEAINALNKTQDQLGVIPDLSVQKFKLYMQMKQPEKAMKEIEEARKVFPEDPQLLSTLVDYYFRSNQEQKGIETLERLAVSDPDNGRVHLFLAEIYKQKGDKKKYYESLNLAFKGQGVELDQKMKVLITLQEENPTLDSKAVELAVLLVEQYPEEAKPYTVLGDYLMSMNRNEEALKAYRNALEYEKGAYAIWNQVMVMEYQTGKFELLFEDSKNCMTFFPSVSTIYLFNGVASNQLKKYRDAISVLETGKEYIVNDNAVLAEFYGQLGEAHFGLKNYKEGKFNYDKAIKLDPKSSLLLNNYAYRLGLAKIDLDNALSMIKEANEKSPNQPHFIDTHGWILFQKGQYKEAMELFERAYRLDNKDKIITEHMGDGSIMLKQIEDALKYWNLAKEQGSTNKALDKKIEKGAYYDPIY